MKTMCNVCERLMFLFCLRTTDRSVHLYVLFFCLRNAWNTFICILGTWKGIGDTTSVLIRMKENNKKKNVNQKLSIKRSQQRRHRRENILPRKKKHVKMFHVRLCSMSTFLHLIHRATQHMFLRVLWAHIQWHLRVWKVMKCINWNIDDVSRSVSLKNIWPTLQSKMFKIKRDNDSFRYPIQKYCLHLKSKRKQNRQNNRNNLQTPKQQSNVHKCKMRIS